MTALRPRHDIHLRRATPDDAAPLAAFGARVFAETFAADNRPEDMALHVAATYEPARQARELDDPALTYVVAEVDRALVGYALVRSGAAPACVPPVALEILRFYVDRPLHGTGVSRALMAECIALAERRGAAALWLGVWERNARAIRFYEKCGFRVVGSQHFTLGTDVQTDRVMVRDFDPRHPPAVLPGRRQEEA